MGPVEIYPGGKQICVQSSASQLIPWLAGRRERGWRWRSELALVSSVSPVFPQGSPVLALLSPPLGCFAQELGLIAFSSYSFHGGHLTRNSSYDPSVSTLFSAKGKTPADFANVWKKYSWLVLLCRAAERWSDVLWYDWLFFWNGSLHDRFAVPTLKQRYCGYVSRGRTALCMS